MPLLGKHCIMQLKTSKYVLKKIKQHNIQLYPLYEVCIVQFKVYQPRRIRVNAVNRNVNERLRSLYNVFLNSVTRNVDENIIWERFINDGTTIQHLRERSYMYICFSFYFFFCRQIFIVKISISINKYIYR